MLDETGDPGGGTPSSPSRLERVNVRICGLGGQGVILAGYLLGDAAVQQGLEAVQTQSYGAEARGFNTHSDVILSRVGPIYFPVPDRFDVLVTLAQPSYDASRKYLAKNGLLVYDEDLVEPSGEHGRGIPVPATRLASSVLGLKVVANIVVLGFLGKLLGFLERGMLEASVREHVPSKFVDANTEAFALGWDYEPGAQ
ncbi:MAG: 2-oxoacid:acceptor oxidoreductase family protein [Promethearchaeota archaeon]